MTGKPFIFILAILLALIVAVDTVSFGSASPGKQYKVSECQSSQGIEICFTDKGTVQENELSTGQINYSILSWVSQTISRDGIVLDGSAANLRLDGVWSSGEPKFLPSTTRSWVVVEGNPCSFDSTFFYTNGEVRRDISNLVCK